MRQGGYAERAQPVGNAANVEGHDRPEIGVDHGRRQPLVFAELGRHLIRGANKSFGEFLGDNARRRSLVRRVEEGVKKTHGDGFDAGIPQGAGRIAHCGLVERYFDTPVMAQPFRHFLA